MAQDIHSACCWNCTTCEGNTFSNVSNQVICKPCPADHLASSDHTTCKKIEEVYLQFSDILVIILLTFSSIGILVLFLTLFVFIWYSNTPVIRASSRNLCYVIMVGIGILFILPIVNIGKPTSLRCKLQPYMIGFVVSLNIGEFLMSLWLEISL